MEPQDDWIWFDLTNHCKQFGHVWSNCSNFQCFEECQCHSSQSCHDQATEWYAKSKDIHVERSLLLVFDDGDDDRPRSNSGSSLVHGDEPDWKWYETSMLRRYWFNPNDNRGGGRSTKAALSHRFLLCFGKTIWILWASKLDRCGVAWVAGLDDGATKAATGSFWNARN